MQRIYGLLRIPRTRAPTLPSIRGSPFVPQPLSPCTRNPANRGRSTAIDDGERKAPFSTCLIGNNLVLFTDTPK